MRHRTPRNIRWDGQEIKRWVKAGCPLREIWELDHPPREGQIRHPRMDEAGLPFFLAERIRNSRSVEPLRSSPEDPPSISKRTSRQKNPDLLTPQEAALYLHLDPVDEPVDLTLLRLRLDKKPLYKVVRGKFIYHRNDLDEFVRRLIGCA